MTFLPFQASCYLYYFEMSASQNSAERHSIRRLRAALQIILANLQRAFRKLCATARYNCFERHSNRYWFRVANKCFTVLAGSLCKSQATVKSQFSFKAELAICSTTWLRLSILGMPCKVPYGKNEMMFFLLQSAGCSTDLV